MKSLTHTMRRTTLVLLAVFTMCLISGGEMAPSVAGEYDWAIPSGPLPDVPPVGDPVCAYCHGSGCSHCQPDVGGDDIIIHPDPAPAPKPAPKPPVQPAPVTPAAPPVNPQQLFERQKEALLKEFRMPAGLMENASIPSVNTPPDAPIEESLGVGPVPAGLSEDEWREAAECQQGLDALYAKWPLGAAEIAEADKLEARRSALWKKAISVPGLTAEERDRLRLKLHTLSPPPGAKIPTVHKDTVKEWRKPPSPPASVQGKPAAPTINPVSSWLVGQFAMGQVQGAIEFGGEQWADQILEEHSFGDFLGVGKIALAYKEGGVASALAETANYLVGKIPIPQANIAVEGGRLYANVVFQAQNKFMTDAMKFTGTEFDKDKFWSDFNEDLNPAQKAVKEWIGYGTD